LQRVDTGMEGIMEWVIHAMIRLVERGKK
jgi:hypothetical protein